MWSWSINITDRQTDGQTDGEMTFNLNTTLYTVVHCVVKRKCVELHLTATECHLPYGITQCYLPPDTSEHTPPNPNQTRFNCHGGGGRIEGWVYLGDWLYTEMIYPPTDGHQSKY